MTQSLTKEDILRLFHALDEELKKLEMKGEIYVVGGAVMTLALNARAATRDVDALFQPSKALREAAARVALDHDVPSDWLNDAAKGFLSAAGTFDSYLELSHLRVLTAQPEYLLAMKCLSMRIGPEFHDEGDVRFLLRYLNLHGSHDGYNRAIEIISRYYPVDRFPQKTLYALEELIEVDS